MRSSHALLVCLPAVVAVLTVFACSDTVNHIAAPVDVPEGGMILDDGAVVDRDGNVVTPVDAAPPPVLVDVTTGNVAGFGTRPDYVLAVPKSYSAAKSYPLALVFHGDGGSGASMRSYHTLDSVSGDEAIVVYPSGKDNTWDLSTAFAMNDDQQYVEALIAALKMQYTIDANRVFGVGWSSGAFLVNILQCRRSLFRSIASHAGGAPFELPQTLDADGYQTCVGTPKVAAFITGGTADTVVDPGSGDFDAKFWAHANGCNPDTRVDTTPAPCKMHATCPAGLPVTYCLIPGDTHAVWPQAVTQEWAFFKALP